MANEKYLDYAGLQHYHEKLLLELGSMEIANNEIDLTMFKMFQTPESAPAQPENWTTSINGILNLSSSTAYVYEPEGAGRKSISLAGNTDEQIFWLKLIDGGNFFIDWDSSIEWASGSEPELTAFHEDIFLFYKENSKWIGTVISSENITPYWKLSVKVPWNEYSYTTGSYSIPTYTVRLNFASLSNDTIIDWGDGTIDGNYQDTHEYSEGGIYHIKITSNNFDTATLMDYLAIEYTYYSPTSYTESLYSVDSPYPLIGGIWRDTSSSNHLETNSFSSCFERCKNLIQIPDKLFYNNPSATYFDNCFSECQSLQSIPAELFSKNVSAISFYQCFYYCSSLQSIPAELFSKNVSATRFDNCFNHCSSLQSIPAELFSKNVSATSFYQCFYYCSSITSIPARLFSNNTAVTDFYQCFYGSSVYDFHLIIKASNVTRITGFIANASNVTRILCVPASSTTYNTATSFANASNGVTVSTTEGDCLDVFEYTIQTDLSQFNDPSFDDDYNPRIAAVPIEPVQNAAATLTIDWGDGNAVELQPSNVTESNLTHTYATIGTYQITVSSSDWSDYKFMASTYVEDSDPSSSDFRIQTFRDKVVSLDAPMPPLANTNLIYWFQYCQHLTTIHSHLFDKLPAVTSAKGCFARCESLTTVPEGLFSNNTAITDFSQCFKNCFGLQTIPAGLFANNVAATDFSSCFNWCQVLQSIPAGLFANNVAATTFRYCFGDCYQIQTIPENLFATNTAVTNFYGCFNDGTNLGGFTIHIGSSLVSSATYFVTKKSGVTRTIYVPASSTTYTTFNSQASTLGLTIRTE